MEKVVVVLDVRQATSGGQHFRQAIKTLVHDKLVHKPNHELGLVVCGCSQTDNTRFDGTVGDVYEHIIEALTLQTVSLDVLRHVDSLECDPLHDNQSCSVPAAVRVAVDMLNRPSDAGKGTRKKVSGKKRIVVLSSTGGVSKDDRQGIREHVSSEGIACQFILLKDADASLPSLDDDVRLVYDAYGMMTCFPTKEVRDAHVVYSHTMSFGGELDIYVKIVPKTKRETFPAMGNVSQSATGDTDGFESSGLWGSHPPTAGEHFRPDDIRQEHPVEQQDRVRGLRFGRNLVPLAEALTALTKVSPDRGVHVLGFMDVGDLPRQLFVSVRCCCIIISVQLHLMHLMSGTCVQTSKILFADKSKADSVAAFCSIVHAMKNLDQVILLRVVLRAGGTVKLMVGIPVANNPAYMILKEVPFVEDVCPMHGWPLPQASEAAVEQVRSIIQSNMLSDDQMNLESINNPILHRSIAFFTEKFLEPDATLSYDPEWLSSVFIDVHIEQMIDYM